MKIGIDIDNCISNFDDVLLKEYLKHDKELRNTGIINDKPYYITVGMFDWSKEENDEFYNNNIQRIAMSLKPLNNAKEVIDKLKADGKSIALPEIDKGCGSFAVFVNNLGTEEAKIIIMKFGNFDDDWKVEVKPIFNKF